MAASVFQASVRDALAGMSLPRAFASFEESMLRSVATVDSFSDFMEKTLSLADKGTGSDDSAAAAAGALRALAEAGSGFEEQLQLLNPSVRAMALANEDYAAQMKNVRLETPAADDMAVFALAKGGQAFSRLTAPFITQGSGHADDVPALLMRDEFVMRQAAVKKYGLSLMYALNNLEIPVEIPTPAVNVAAYASGGAVNDTDAATEYYHTFTPPADAVWSRKELSAYAETLVQGVRDSLGLERMQNNAQAYLADILSAFGSDSRSIALFAPGGSAYGPSSALRREKNRISNAYAQKIQNARDLGNGELTELYELQLNTLLNLIDELLHTLEQLANKYLKETQESLEEYEKEFDAIQEEAGEQLALLYARYRALGQGTTLINNLGGSAGAERDLQGQVKNTLYAVQDKRADDEEEAELLYRTRTQRLLQMHKLESEYEARAAASDGKKESIKATADLRRAFLETLADIQNLESERDAQLAELVNASASGRISGSAEYLRNGGVVGALAALGRLLDRQGLSWSAGLPLSAVRAFAQGGLVSGGIPGHDSVPALLTPGEYVLNTRAVERIGLSALESANARAQRLARLPSPPGFAQGGRVNGARLAQAQQEHLIRLDLGATRATVRTDSDNLRSLVRGLKEVQKRMVR